MPYPLFLRILSILACFALALVFFVSPLLVIKIVIVLGVVVWLAFYFYFQSKWSVERLTSILRVYLNENYPESAIVHVYDIKKLFFFTKGLSACPFQMVFTCRINSGEDKDFIVGPTNLGFGPPEVKEIAN